MTLKLFTGEIDSSNNTFSWTVPSGKTHVIHAASITTASTSGTKIRAELQRGSTRYQFAHDIYIPPEKVVEFLIRGHALQSDNEMHVFFASGAPTSTTFIVATVDEI